MNIRLGQLGAALNTLMTGFVPDFALGVETGVAQAAGVGVVRNTPVLTGRAASSTRVTSPGAEFAPPAAGNSFTVPGPMLPASPLQLGQPVHVTQDARMPGRDKGYSKILDKGYSPKSPLGMRGPAMAHVEVEFPKIVKEAAAKAKRRHPVAGAILFAILLAAPGFAQPLSVSRLWARPAVANVAALPATNNLPGDTRMVLESLTTYTWSGTAWAQSASSQGPQGEPGIAATISARNTTTGAPGSGALVTNAGTSSARLLDFLIPEGVAGATGPQGPTGAAGANGADGIPRTIQDEETPLPQQVVINFAGAGVTCADSQGASRTDCTIPDGGAGKIGGTVGGTADAIPVADSTGGATLKASTVRVDPSGRMIFDTSAMIRCGSSTDQTYFAPTGCEIRNAAGTQSLDLGVRQLMLGTPDANGGAVAAMFRTGDAWLGGGDGGFCIQFSDTPGSASNRVTFLCPRTGSGRMSLGTTASGVDGRLDLGVIVNTPRASPPFTCDASVRGAVYVDTSDADCVCLAGAWQNRLPLLGGSCS